jgi:hypothetical protein
MNIILVLILALLIGYLFYTRKQEARQLAAKAPDVPAWFVYKGQLQPSRPLIHGFISWEDQEYLKKYYAYDDDYYYLNKVAVELKDYLLAQIDGYNQAIECWHKKHNAWQLEQLEGRYFEWKIYFANELIKRT